MSGLLADLLVEEGHYGPNIRLSRARREFERHEKYVFNGKLAVGSFSSLEDCPKKIIGKKSQGRPRFKTKTLYKLDLGDEIHKSYQAASQNTPNFKWVKPYNWPTDKDLLKRFNQVWEEDREVMCWYIDSTGMLVVTGKVDDCVDYYGRPLLVEIKTIGKFSDKEFRFGFDKPLERHVMQLKSYLFLIKRSGLYLPFVPTKGEIHYICTDTDSDHGDEAAEKSFYVELEPGDEEKFISLYEESGRQLRAYSDKVDLECQHKYCKEHNEVEFIL